MTSNIGHVPAADLDPVAGRARTPTSSEMPPTAGDVALGVGVLLGIGVSVGIGVGEGVLADVAVDVAVGAASATPTTSTGVVLHDFADPQSSGPP